MQRLTSRRRSTRPPRHRRRPDTRSSCRPSSSPPSTSPTPAASSTPPPAARRPQRPKVSRGLDTVENGDVLLETFLAEQRFSVVVFIKFVLPCRSLLIVRSNRLPAVGEAEDVGRPCFEIISVGLEFIESSKSDSIMMK